MAVYIIPIMPASEKGARDDRFFIKQRGRRTSVVTPSRTFVLPQSYPIVERRALKLSAKTIEYARMAHPVLNVQDTEGIQLVSVPTVLSQAFQWFQYFYNMC